MSLLLMTVAMTSEHRHPLKQNLQQLIHQLQQVPSHARRMMPPHALSPHV